MLLELSSSIVKWKDLHPRNLTQIPKIAIFKGSYLFQTIILGIHVSFRECIPYTRFPRTILQFPLFRWVDWTWCYLAAELEGDRDQPHGDRPESQAIARRWRFFLPWQFSVAELGFDLSGCWGVLYIWCISEQTQIITNLTANMTTYDIYIYTSIHIVNRSIIWSAMNRYLSDSLLSRRPGCTIGMTAMAWPLAAGGSAQRLAATRLGVETSLFHGRLGHHYSLLYVSCVLFYISKAI